MTGWGAITPLESDESLRKRLHYVADESGVAYERIERAEGQALDDLAWRFNLRRRRS